MNMEHDATINSLNISSLFMNTDNNGFEYPIYMTENKFIYNRITNCKV